MKKINNKILMPWDKCGSWDDRDVGFGVKVFFWSIIGAVGVWGLLTLDVGVKNVNASSCSNAEVESFLLKRRGVKAVESIASSLKKIESKIGR